MELVCGALWFLPSYTQKQGYATGPGRLPVGEERGLTEGELQRCGPRFDHRGTQNVVHAFCVCVSMRTCASTLAECPPHLSE